MDFKTTVFLSTVLKLGSHVLGTKKKLPVNQKFDLGLRSENEKCYLPKIV